MTSLNDHAMMHDEFEGTLGPVTYAMLSETPKDNESRNKKHDNDSKNKKHDSDNKNNKHDR